VTEAAGCKKTAQGFHATVLHPRVNQQHMQCKSCAPTLYSKHNLF